MKLDNKILYYLEYNPVTGQFHHNTGKAPLNTFDFYQISELMDDTLFAVFQELMESKYDIKDTREFPTHLPSHLNPAVSRIKKEWQYFLKVIEAVDKRRVLFAEKT